MNSKEVNLPEPEGTFSVGKEVQEGASAKRTAQLASPHALRASLSILIFLSGASALLYEVAWVRMMGLAVGSTTQAASIVIAAFLGGLALGGWLAGVFARRIRTSFLLVYAALELGIALTAPIVSCALQNAPTIFAAVAQHAPDTALSVALQRIALSMVLLPPTILMGATLPIVTAILVKFYAQPASYFSMLYGLNTLGAVVGSLSATYLGFPFAGIFSSILMAALVNLGVAVTATVLWGSAGGDKQSREHQTFATEGAEPLNGELAASDSLSPARLATWLAVVSGFLGFTALSYEILWIRLLRMFIGSSTYSFTAMMSTFLLGLVAGSLIYNHKLRVNADLHRDVPAHLRLLSITQLGAAVFCLLGILLLPGVMIVRAALEVLNSTHDLPAGAYLLYFCLCAFSLLIVPSIFIGCAFPLIGGLATSTSRQVAKAVGNTYAANTVGCILGSLVTGLILIPTIGSQYAMETIVTITTLTAMAIDWKVRGAGSTRRLVLTSVPLVLMLVFLPNNYLERTYCSLSYGKLLRAVEDAIGNVFCVEYKLGRRLIVNGVMFSGDTFQGLRYMRTLGHLPVLLNRSPKTALVVCFGIGSTCGAVAKHKEITHLDICEISPAVLSCANIFEATNSGVLKRKNVECHLEDGRNYLLRTTRKYDVLSFEPPPPSDAGIVNLYSKEFYQLCKQHLNPGGVLCQWMPMHGEYGASAQIWKMMVNTPADVFPYSALLLPNSMEGILVASDQPIRLDVADIEERMKNSPELKESLDQVGLSDPYDIAATILIGTANLRKFLSGAGLITDDHPTLEFFLPFPGANIYPDDLEPYQSDLHEILTNGGKPLDEQRLSRSVETMRELRAASTAAWKMNPAAAKEHIKRAFVLEPNNTYVRDFNAQPNMK